ncbi:hypothetical protein [Bacillus cereus group sp. BfR-BA-01492]|uniref:hypothetical protein n=1 Tax=Bacillus cereus group sp. BfR-BA-01492 TaxID=2920361 RepID=UPI001F56E081|nr:hypothetical protein [Bacillus cereus group sp. BfR-BA-01492]
MVLNSYYKACIIGGTFGTGKVVEFKEASRGQYVPVWVPLKELLHINIKSYKIAPYIVQREV